MKIVKQTENIHRVVKYNLKRKTVEQIQENKRIIVESLEAKFIDASTFCESLS